ncbi:hypothetical protein V495_07940 [Pseudogymnoascus sp. VKM F-4514 (FW-929)]|nr:hypothetical protein V495_07940 [Pseudogymnoascus sp. VKM F-4514 (FW-929)]
MNAAIPSIVVYIAKLLGKNAVDALNTPGLDTIASRKKSAMRGLSVMLMTLNNCVWHTAQKNASVETDVGPAADGVGGAVFPGLETGGVGEVVGWFPVVEGFVAVFDGGVEGGEEVEEEEEPEGCDGLHGEGLGAH